MKKKSIIFSFTSERKGKKLLLIMRLSLILMFATFFSTSASVYSQAVKVNLDLKEATLEKVFQDIQSQTDFDFFYKNEHLPADKIYNVSFVDTRIDKVLDKLLEGTGLIYRVLNKDIVITRGEDSDSGRNELFQQQQKTIEGVVTDKNGQPLPGVTVLIKGTTNGTITSNDGEYTLGGVTSTDIIVFSFVGMSSQEVEVGEQQSINIALEDEKMALDEVIVIGYGTAKRKDFTGSVSSVKMENSAVALLPNTNALESLKGNVSGLNIGASNSAGGEPDMLIRGQNSINGSNDPLIVLDGVIFMGSLSDINPNDIASFDILKDAVSAAAYGSRAANGVIAITTKRGSSAKPVISFNTSTGIQSWYSRPEMMKGDEYIKVINARNGYTEGSTYWMTNQEAENYNNGVERVWLDDVTQVGIIEDLQLAVSGAGKGLNYYLSAAYSYNKGVVVGDDFDRISIMGKINTNITDWLKIGVDAGYTRRDYSGFGANIGTAQVVSPYGVMYRDDNKNLEKYPVTQSYVNPLWGVDDGTRDNMDIRQSFRLNTYAVINIPGVKGLSYRLNFSPNYELRNFGEFYHENYYIGEGDAVDASRYAASTIVNYLSSAHGSLGNEKTYSYVWDNIVNYKNSFGKHNIEATLVATRDYSKYKIMYTTGSDFSANGNTLLGMYGLHNAEVQKVDLYVNNKDINSSKIGGTEKSNIGYLGRISYSYNDRYYMTGSFRRDGASVFGLNKKWGNFAALGLAWKISEEDFMDGVKPLDDLKLKVSWGQNGNQGIGPYTTLSKIANGSTGGYRYEFSDNEGAIYYGMIQSTLGNYDLGWESTEALNAGFESAWLKNRLFVDVDAYFSKTTDQIFERNIPVMTGFKTIMTSMGQVNNVGVEATIRALLIEQNDWRWMSSVTYWKNNNKLVKLYGEDNDGDGKEDDDVSNSLFIGKSLKAIYGYEQDGIVQEGDTEYIALTGTNPGDPKYKDLDGIDGITSEDRKILGYEKENFRLNMSNNVSYKDFELYVLVTGVFGGNDHYLKSNKVAYMTAGTGRANDNMTSKPYWTPENKSNVFPSASFAGDGRYQGLQSRGFVRVQDISLSYTFHQRWVKSANLNSLKVFFAAKNLITFTNWDGGDPETGALYLANTYPVVTTYSLGASISF